MSENNFTRSQLEFILRAVGKYWIYSQNQGYPGKSYIDSVISDINNPVGNLGRILVKKYDLEYENNSIVLRKPATVDEIKKDVEVIGMMIPDSYSKTPERALKYFEEYGQYYKKFNKKYNYVNGMEWETSGDSFIRFPSMTGYDFYLNLYLRVHLRDLFTDFDILQRFKNIPFENRPDLIERTVKQYQPAGVFRFSFGFSTIQLVHTFGNLVSTYNNIIDIKNIAREGKLSINSTPLNAIGLYILAFLTQPQYIRRIYNVELSEALMTQIKILHVLFVRQIKIYEASTGRKMIRFGKLYQELNQDIEGGFDPEEIQKLIRKLNSETDQELIGELRGLF